MHKQIWFGLAVLSMVSVSAPAAQPPPTGHSYSAADADIAIRALLDTAEWSIKNNQFEGAILSLGPIVTDGGHNHDLYADLSDATRLRVDKAYGMAASRLGMSKEAHQSYVRSSQSPVADEEAWYHRYQSAKADGDFADMYIAISTWTEKWPQPIFGLRDQDVSQTERGLGTLPNAAQAQLAFEQYLDRIAWEPQDPFFTKAVIRFHQAEHLYERGDKAAAYRIAAGIEDTYGLQMLLADKRFDPLVSQDPGKFDIRAAGDKKVQRARKEVGQNPQWLEARNTLVSWLMELGREDEAMKEVDAALAMAERVGTVAPRYDASFGNQYATSRTLKTFLLFDLGHYEESLQLGANIPGCRCGPNSNQALVMADLLVRLGRGKNALEWLMPFVNAKLDIQDQAERAYLLSCAAFQAHNPDIAEENLDFLKRHENYGPSWLLLGLLCANDLEKAAVVTVKGLDDPFERPLILEELQHYLAPKVRTAFDKLLDARKERLLTRRDVTAAVDRIGHINSYKIINLGPMY